MSDQRSSHHDVLAAFGLFMVTWSIFENLLEATIMRQAKLEPAHAHIMTSGIGFERKASICRSLLSMEPGNDEVISLINSITQTASRNFLVHGQIFTGERSLEFVKRDTSQSYRWRSKTFDGAGLMSLVTEVNELVIRLQTALSITDEELNAYAKAGQQITA